MMQIHDCEQGTEAWLRCRMGMPTASEFATVMAKGKGGEDSKTRRTYMFKLAGEIVTGEPMEAYTNPYLERGKMMEAEARALYAFMTDSDPQRVGFVTNNAKGCSPDAFLGDAGMLELKTASPHILIPHLLKGEFPPEHQAQCQGALWVCEREFIDLVIYWPKMPLFKMRAYRDEPYIKTMAAAVDQFNTELQTLLLALDQKAAAA